MISYLPGDIAVKEAYDTSPHNRPRRWPRVVSVSIGQSGISPPHNSLQFPEFGKETGSFVIDFRRIEWYWISAGSKEDVRAYVGHGYWSRCTTTSCHKLGSCYKLPDHQLASLVITRMRKLTSCCSNPHSGNLTLCENR